MIKRVDPREIPRNENKLVEESENNWASNDPMEENCESFWKYNRV
jgi:hypothetical protein